MIELLLLIFFCRDLFKRATYKKENGWGWIFRYISLVVSIYMFVGIIVLKYYGAGALTQFHVVLIVSIVGIMSDTGLYYLLRNIISKLPDNDDKDEFNEVEKSSDSSGDKDLSYFR